ncbi:MAG: excinuclease ABC subunit UvrB [Patescibacteria group bacterium]
MGKFRIKSEYKPTPDQKRAINKLARGIKNKVNYQVLLGVTGSGKTFSVANVIEKLQRPTLIISHNKTLAAQLYQEFRDFFPENSVNYFVSYYDYYQPEAYIPSTDTYIEKDADINELIDKLRLATTTNLLTRNDVIVVASVSCIYNIGSPREYGNFVFEFSEGVKIGREQIIDRLLDLQYERGDFGFHRGAFRVRGNSIDIYPAYQDKGFRLELGTDDIKKVDLIDPISGSPIPEHLTQNTNYILYPAKHYITDPNKNKNVFSYIRRDLKDRVEYFKKKGKLLEANRIKQKVNYDLDMIEEIGYVKGIENYSRYFDRRKKGDPPYTLLDYFGEPYKKDWLVIVDESHMTFPQIRGMYAGDLSRKKTLVDYGFRLPAAYDNRPLTFDEFMRRIPGFIATSATPADWEISLANENAHKSGKLRDPTSKLLKKGVVEQLLRPTGIPDPGVEIRPVSSKGRSASGRKNQVSDVVEEIKKCANPPAGEEKQRVLVTTLTKRSAEDLSQYLREQEIQVHYLHSDVATLERSDILDDLRRGKYDCIVGVNLLREGLDLPEVSLVAILDADKEGFLRSEVSLIQTMGRASRHVNGRVILYADNVTGSMKRALKEVERRRKYQVRMNKKLGIKPKSIKKPIRERLVEEEKETTFDKLFRKGEKSFTRLPDIDTEGLIPMDRKKLANKLRSEMRIAAQELNFELAAEIRDKILEISV